MYGIDWDGPCPSRVWGSLPDEETQGINILPTEVDRTQQALDALRANVNPLAVSANFGVDLYESALQVLFQLNIQ